MVTEATHIILRGNTMGTTYLIHYLDKDSRNIKPEIEGILKDFNQSLSTYISDSDISIFNRAGSVNFRYPYFYPVLKEAKRIYLKTNGYFNPTLYHLINKYGFGPSNEVPSSKDRNILNPEVIEFNKEGAFSKKQVQLDLNAIAKGYAIDVIGEYLESKEISNYIIEIGGDIRARGAKANTKWNAGIIMPDYGSKAEVSILEFPLNNYSLATSGPYRNYSMDSSRTLLSHLINPKTKDARINEILSVTVLAKNCITADAYATGISVAGLKKATEWTETLAKEGVYVLAFFSGEKKYARIYCSNLEYFGLAKKNIAAFEKQINTKLQNRN